MPYPAKFDLPTLFSDSLFKLTWRVNCSTPIINYQLEFRELPLGDWVALNVPGDFGSDPGSRRSPYEAMRARKYGNPVEEHGGAYTLKGLASGTSYEVQIGLSCLGNFPTGS